MSTTGILVVDKTAGVTSFDAVALVRRRLGLKRVGHAGTLDPDATGVLPMLLDEATKLMAYLADQDKEYVATLRLGVTTDTGDMSGRVVAEAPVGNVDRAQVEAACQPFLGRIKQVPPMYSAVHHGGRRLYELAREGVEVVREPREVVIHAIEVQEVAPPDIGLRVVCGKGTYLRTPGRRSRRVARLRGRRATAGAHARRSVQAGGRRVVGGADRRGDGRAVGACAAARRCAGRLAGHPARRAGA